MFEYSFHSLFLFFNVHSVVCLALKGVSMSEEAIGQLKQELEEVVEGLNQRLAESRKQTREMEARIHDLEKERDLLGEKLSKRNSIEGEVDGLQRQLDGETLVLIDKSCMNGEISSQERNRKTAV